MPYVPCCTTRFMIISYTPPLITSGSNRRSGPPSGKTHAAPVVDISRSVAAKMMAPPTRLIGVRGTPAVTILCSRLKRPVSVCVGKLNKRTKHDDCKPVKNGWMTPTRIFFCASGKANARAIPKTPHFVAEYIGPVAVGCQDAVRTFRGELAETTLEHTHRAEKYY